MDKGWNFYFWVRTIRNCVLYTDDIYYRWLQELYDKIKQRHNGSWLCVCIMLMYSHAPILHLKPFTTTPPMSDTSHHGNQKRVCLCASCMCVRDGLIRNVSAHVFIVVPPPLQWAYCLMKAPLGHGERPRAFVIIVITVSGNQGPTCHLSSPPHHHHHRGDLQATCTHTSVCVCVYVGEVHEEFVVAATSVNLYKLSRWQLHTHMYTHTQY